jgi:hypothetical protein
MRRIFVSDKSFIFAIQIVEACEDLHKIAVAAESICKILKGQGKTKFNKQFARSGELLEFHKRISKTYAQDWETRDKRFPNVRFIIRRLEDGREQEAQERLSAHLEICKNIGKEIFPITAFTIDQLPKI